MKYNFDEIVERRGTNSMNTDGFREYIFHADDTMTFPYKDEEFVRMWIADMEFATPDIIINAVKERLDKRIFGYTKIFDPEYYKAFANWTQKKYGWSCEKKDLVTSPGIIPALYELIEYITNEDENVLITTPSYAYFKHAVDYHKRNLVCSNLINEDGYYKMDFDDFEEKAKDSKTTLFILSNPHNPTGRIWTAEELKLMGEICQRNNVWIISDEIHCDIIRSNMQHTPLAKVIPDYDKIVTCMAPSKTFNMAGLMLSNIIIPNEKLHRKWKERHYDFDNPLNIAAVQAAYTYGEEWLDEMKTYLDLNFEFIKQYLTKHLPLAKFCIPEATYLAWVDISAYIDTDQNLPMFFANNAGVLLEGGNMFVQNSTGFIRLNLACPRSILQIGLARIATALKKENK